MKKKDIIKLVKETIAERRKHYGQHDYYGNNVGGRSSISGMPGVWEDKKSTSRKLKTQPFPVVGEGQSWGFEIRQLADSFTFDELEQLKTFQKISQEDLNGAKSYLQSWIAQHPTYLPQRDLTEPKRQAIRDKYLNESPMFGKKEPFTKDYGSKISPEDFKNKMPIGKTVLYGGTRYKVLENDGYVLTLQSIESKNITKVNLGQFIDQGAINEKNMKKNKIEKNIDEDISDDISKAEDEVQAATQTKADAESKVADARKKKADATKSALEEDDKMDIHREEGIKKGAMVHLDPYFVEIRKMKLGDGTVNVGRALIDLVPGTGEEPASSKFTEPLAEYMKERGNDNLMEHMDKHRRRPILMESATEKLFAMFNDGKTNDDVIHHYSLQRIEMPDSFVAKLRKNWEDLRKSKLELTLADKEAEGFNQTVAQSSQEVGMERGVEEKQLASGLKGI